MKLLLLLLAALSLPTAAGASINPYDLLVRADASSRTVTLRTTRNVAEATRVLLQDAAGAELFGKQLRRGDYLSLRFEMSNLPSGAYDLIIRDSRGQTTQPIRVDGDRITADPAMADRVFFPRCTLVGERTLSVNYLNHRGQPVVIRLEDDRGREVFTETVNGDTPIQRAYELSSLPAGRYRVSLRARTIGLRVTTLELE